MADLKWHGPAAQAQVEAEFKRRLSAAAIYLAAYCKRLVGVEGAGKSAPGRDEAGKFTKGKLRYGENPSGPGDPPHKQTGRLQGSITWELTGLTARVGTNLRYGRWLELGTRLIAARPWLRRALAECRAAILAILSRPTQ